MSYLKQIEKEYRLIRIYDNANKKIDNIRYKKKKHDFFFISYNWLFLIYNFYILFSLSIKILLFFTNVYFFLSLLFLTI